MGLITKPFSFVAGQKPTASQWNSIHDTVYNLLNGQLDSANVDKTSADAVMVLDTAQTRTAALTMSAGLIFSGTVDPAIDLGANGNRIDLDAAGTSSLRASANNVVVLEVGGADVWEATATGIGPVEGYKHTLSAGTSKMSQYIIETIDNPSSTVFLDVDFADFDSGFITVEMVGRNSNTAARCYSKLTWALTTSSAVAVTAGTQVDIGEAFTFNTSISTLNLQIDVTKTVTADVRAIITVISDEAHTIN